VIELRRDPSWSASKLSSGQQIRAVGIAGQSMPMKQKTSARGSFQSRRRPSCFVGMRKPHCAG
jgi:hypothetical protein